MNTREDDESVRRDGWFVTVAALVGDLGHPFYREERQRDVWNEATAVALQVVLWLGVAAAAAMVWAGGAASLPYAITIMAVLGTLSGVSALYAHQLGVRFDDTGGLLRLRLAPFGVLLVVLFVGMARVAPAEDLTGGFVRGMAGGSAAALLWLIVSGLRARRRVSR